MAGDRGEAAFVHDPVTSRLGEGGVPVPVLVEVRFVD